MTLLASFQILLSRCTGREDIVVGTPTAGRNRAELEQIIGFFINPVVLRLDLGGRPTLTELLGRTRRVVLGALAHQDLPFEILVEELRPLRDRSRAPVYQVAFGLQNVPAAQVSMRDVDLRSLGQTTTTAKLDLDLNMGDAEDGLGGSLEYNTDLFDRTTAQRFLQHFSRLLEDIVGDPDQRISDLRLLGDPEVQQLLVEWNDTAARGGEGGIHEIIAAQAERQPNALVVVFGEERLTYLDLDRRANQVARYLSSLGVGPEVLVGLCLERSLDMVVGLLGVMKAGAAYLPLDPSYPAGRLAFMLEDAQPSVLLTNEQAAQRLPVYWGLTVSLDGERAAIAAAGEGRLDGGAGPENTVYVIYTSGSTGSPKGVAVSHRGLHNLAEAQMRGFGLTRESRVLQFASLSFDASISEIAMTLCAGAALHLAPREVLMSAQSLARLIEDSGITHVTLPASLLSSLDPGDLPSAITVIAAGEACPAELVERWTSRHRLFNAYGPTESTVCASFDRCAEGDQPSIGRPIDNLQTYLLDDCSRPVPVGVVGELHIGGLGLAQGYLRRPDLTAERFIPGPLGQPGARLYRTGDLARYRADGRLDFVGRRDQQVKVRGFRIELGEVEAALLQYPGVREAAALARGKSLAERRLVAYLSCRQPERPAALEVRRFLQGRLPDYMIPSVFVFLDALPLRPNGKIDRDALPEPGIQVAQENNGHAVPRNPVEETLADIWAEVLGIDRVGIHESFFDLGGYSLSATQVLARVRESFGVELSLGRFFERPTIAAFGADVEQAIRSGNVQIPRRPASRTGDLPLSFAQEVVWLAEQREPGRYAAHVPFAFRLSGDLDVAALEASLNEIVRRHEVLRTTFPVAAGVPCQRVHPFQRLPLRTIDFEAVPQSGQLAAVTDLARQEARRLFDLERGPLTRWLLFRLDSREHVLLLVCHHIVIDQWSGGIFSQEIKELYQAFLEGQAVPLAELPVQYADFASWQRQWLQGEVLEAQLAYWRHRLAGAAALALPTDAPRSAALSAHSADVSVLLSPTVTAALHALSRRQGATLFMTLLAAYKLLLHHFTGQSDIVVSSPIANRRWREIEPLIGFFPNMLLLRTDVGRAASYLDLLRRVREVTLEAYTHQDLSFEVLAEKIGEVASREFLRVSCNFYNAPAPPLQLKGLSLTRVDVGLELTETDLVLLLQESPLGLRCGFFYRRDLFKPGTMVRLKERFQALLESVAADPEQTLADLMQEMDKVGGEVGAVGARFFPLTQPGSREQWDLW